MQSMGQTDQLKPGVAIIENVLPGDKFLVTSDGLTGVVSDAALLEMLTHPTPKAATLLAEKCVADSIDNYAFALIEAVAA